MNNAAAFLNKLTDLMNWKWSFGWWHHHPAFFTVNSKCHQSSTFLVRAEPGENKFSERSKSYDSADCSGSTMKYSWANTRDILKKSCKEITDKKIICHDALKGVFACKWWWNLVSPFSLNLPGFTLFFFFFYTFPSVSWQLQRKQAWPIMSWVIQGSDEVNFIVSQNTQLP